MWAVGLLCDIDKGYAIWSGEDFGMLFWKDAPSGQKQFELAQDVCDAGVDGESKSSDTVTTNVSKLGVAIATTGSKEIIEKDQEYLRRVFLLERDQTRQQLVLSKEQKVREETSVVSATPMRVLRVTKNDSTPKPQRKEKHSQGGADKKKGMWNRRRDFNKIKRGETKTMAQKGEQVLPLANAELTPLPTCDLRRTHSAPATPSPVKVSLDQLLNRTIAQIPISTSPSCRYISTQSLLDRHFPPLEKQVVHQVEFPGLHTEEFFRVFFADDAPYSMRDFQIKRGDVDVVYGEWGAPEGKESVTASFKTGVDRE
jgi:hypothetical protein